MKAEIDSLLALDKFDGEPLVKAYDAMEASIIRTADKVRYSLLFPSLPSSQSHLHSIFSSPSLQHNRSRC
jgi:hypothetical protein